MVPFDDFDPPIPFQVDTTRAYVLRDSYEKAIARNAKLAAEVEKWKQSAISAEKLMEGTAKELRESKAEVERLEGLAYCPRQRVVELDARNKYLEHCQKYPPQERIDCAVGTIDEWIELGPDSPIVSDPKSALDDLRAFLTEEPSGS